VEVTHHVYIIIYLRRLVSDGKVCHGATKDYLLLCRVDRLLKK